MNRWTSPAVAAALASFIASCAYTHARAVDLADCFSGSVALGAECSIDVQATDLLHLGVGAGTHGEAGFVGRRYGTAGVTMFMLPTAPMSEQVVYLRSTYDLSGTWTEEDIQDECYGIHLLDMPPTNPKRPWLDAWDVEVGAVALVGGRVGLRPGQMLDLLCGLFGVDPAGDDGDDR